MPAAPSEHYVVISSDTHGGADLLEYRPYLSSAWHEEFDAWAAQHVNPYESEHLLTNDPRCNWDSDMRRRLLESQGVVGEVIFPNTVPPFYPNTQFFVPPPPSSRAEYERRWAGLQAHNRWLADFCADLPGRRAGVAQIMLNDIDDAVREIRYVKEAGLTGGILMPGAPPGNLSIEPLFSPVYDPIWAACAESDVPVNIHSGGGVPDFKDTPVARAVFLLTEVRWYSNRNLLHLIMGGVFERHPRLKVAFTEQGSGWVPAEVAMMDTRFLLMGEDRSAQHFFGGEEIVGSLSMLPSEYFARNCWMGASPFTREECGQRYDIGVDRIMFGNDFPHVEGTYPYGNEALRYALAGVPEEEMRAILGGNAAHVYGFDLAALAPVAAQVGPTVEELATPLEVIPADSFSMIFAGEYAKRKRQQLAGSTAG